jgi:hypothetical protein
LNPDISGIGLSVEEIRINIKILLKMADDEWISVTKREP